jgi:two-component system response regulator
MQSASPKLILCADDDTDDRELLCDTIRQIEPEYQVEHSANGEELLVKLEELVANGHTPCLIILDMNMPKKDGKTTVIEIKEHPQWSKIPVAILTTSARHLYADLELKYNVPIVTKPGKVATLVHEVSELLKHCS